VVAVSLPQNPKTPKPREQLYSGGMIKFISATGWLDVLLFG